MLFSILVFFSRGKKKGEGEKKNCIDKTNIHILTDSWFWRTFTEIAWWRLDYNQNFGYFLIVSLIIGCAYL